MDALFKNQLLKHLSKFAKNLASTNINLSTFKGEGELFNLDLNEKVLTDLLELPLWMEIRSATVNKVTAKIPWVKLKSCPIILRLDKVHIVIKTLPNLREPEPHAGNSSFTAPSKYGLVNKAIDGITVEVESVFIEIQRDAFTANIEISQMSLKSRNTIWRDCSTDLRASRLKDPNVENVLIFKELRWMSTRIVIHGPQQNNQPPVRLHTKVVICRITIKKKISDCSVIGCRLALIMDKIDWCLTDSQLLLLVQFTDSISELVKKATEESHKTKAARKLEFHLAKSMEKNNPKSAPQNTSQPTAMKKGISNLEVEKWMVFRKFDIIETSYHFACNQVLLCIYEDTGMGRSVHECLKKGSSMAIRFLKIKIDHFPYHVATGDRKHWIKYQEGNIYDWTRSAINQFKVKLVDSLPGKSTTSHTPLGRATPHMEQNQGSKKEELSTEQHYALKQFSNLMATCTVFSCADMDIQFARNIEGDLIHKYILTVDKKGEDVSSLKPFLEAELSYFFYPGGFKFPVPSPKLFMHVEHVVAHFDPASLIWANALATNLDYCYNKEAKPVPYMDIYIESHMAKAVVESVDDNLQTLENSSCMKIHTSRVILSNVRESDPKLPGSTSSLFNCLEDAQKSELFFLTEFPSHQNDLQPILPKLLKHATGEDSFKSPNEVEKIVQNSVIDVDTLWTEARDIFFIHMASVWVEFSQHRKQRGFRCVEPFPLNVWVYPRLEDSGSHEKKLQEFHNKTLEGRITEGTKSNNEANLYVIAHSNTLVSIQISRQEYLFITRLLDTMTEIGSFLTFDSSRIKEGLLSTLIASVIFPQVDISFVLPVHTIGDTTPSVGDEENLSSKDTTTFNSTENIPISITKETLLKSQSEGCLGPDDTLSVSLLVRNAAKSGEHVGPRNPENGSRRGSPHRDVTPEDMDAMSLASNESDNFEHLHWVGGHTVPDVMFVDTKYDQQIECGVEATELATESNHSDLDAQLHRKVTTMTVSMNKFRLIIESIGFDSLLKLESNSIASEELLHYPFQEFLSKIEERSHKWTPQSMIAKPCRFKIRMATEGKRRPNFLVPKGLDSPESLFPRCHTKSNDSAIGDRYSTVLPVDRSTFLEGDIADLEFSIHNSTSISLSDLIEDELVPLPLPMKIQLTNILIEMLEEKTSKNGPASFSYNIKIPILTILRNNANDITLTNEVTSPDITKQLMEKDEEIRKLRNEKEKLELTLKSLEQR